MIPSTRRRFLGTSAALSAAALAGRGPVHAKSPESPAGLSLKQGATILIQGDSITDAGRDKKMLEPNQPAALGKGYARLIAYHLLAKHPEKELKIYNRGISGNKVPDLEGRWERDCLELKPDILSIMIGVNDYWHTVAFGSKYEGTVESYGTGLTALLERTREALPEVQLVLCEPFVVRTADNGPRKDWFPEFDHRRAKAREAAESVGAVFVPFQEMFDAAVAAGFPNKQLAGDDIHPSSDGHALMASRWLGDTGLA